MIELALYFFAALGALCVGTLLTKTTIGIFNWFKFVNGFMHSRGGQIAHMLDTNSKMWYKIIALEQQIVLWKDQEDE
jgi:hypothetical protein